MAEYKYELNRLIQLPIDSVEFSKNLINVTAKWDNLKDVEKDLRDLFANQMADFKTQLEELKKADEYIKMLKAYEFVQYLQSKSPIAAAVIKQKELFFNLK